jgi:hypothetical protein
MKKQLFEELTTPEVMDSEVMDPTKKSLPGIKK